MKPRPANAKESAVTWPNLTRMELKQVEEQVSIGLNVVYETIRRQGHEELGRATSGLSSAGSEARLPGGLRTSLPTTQNVTH